MRVAVVSVSSILLCGCGPAVTSSGGETDAGTSSSTSSAGFDAGTTMAVDTTSAAELTSTSATSEPPVDPSYDLGANTSTTEGPEDACAVDFLFVIDNSGSMGPFQAALIAGFPDFIDAIGVGANAHVMVVDTDPPPAVDCPAACEQASETGCLLEDGTCPLMSAVNPLCTFSCLELADCLEGAGGCEDPSAPDSCEIMGAGIVFPKGTDASNVSCDFASGARYMDAEEPDLSSAFACAAQVGTGALGAAEEPMGSMLQAVTSGTPANDCNEGFLRDDAALVVTIITDENDDEGDGSPGTVEGWRQALIAAKNGAADSIVVLGLLGGGVDCGEESPRSVEFVESWGAQGRVGSICAPDYSPFLEDASRVVSAVCGGG